MSTSDWWLRIDRANEHLAELESVINDYLGAKPYRIVGQYESQSRQYVLRAEVIQDPPGRIGILVGDACHSLRTALDQLVYRLASPPGGGEAPSGTEFPIFKDDSAYFAVEKSGKPARGSGLYKIRGITSTPASTLIETLQPYHRTHDPEGDNLWMLHSLDIVDKHRKRHVTGTIYEGASVGINELDGWDLDFAHVGGLKAGAFQNHAEVARFAAVATKPNPKMHMNLNVTFGVAFNPVGPARGEPVLTCLSRLRDFVRDEVVAKLEVFV